MEGIWSANEIQVWVRLRVRVRVRIRVRVRERVGLRVRVRVRVRIIVISRYVISRYGSCEIQYTFAYYVHLRPPYITLLRPLTSVYVPPTT